MNTMNRYFFAALMVITSMVCFEAKSQTYNYVKDSAGKIRTDFNRNEARRHCLALGGRLPTIQEAVSLFGLDQKVFTIQQKSDAIKIIDHVLANNRSDVIIDLVLQESYPRHQRLVLSHMRSNPGLFQRHIDYLSNSAGYNYAPFTNKGENTALSKEQDIIEILNRLIESSILGLEKVRAYAPPDYLSEDFYYLSSGDRIDDGRLSPCNLKVWTSSVLNEAIVDNAVPSVFVCADGNHSRRPLLIYDTKVTFNNPSSRAALVCVK